MYTFLPLQSIFFEYNKPLSGCTICGSLTEDSTLGTLVEIVDWNFGGIRRSRIPPGLRMLPRMRDQDPSGIPMSMWTPLEGGWSFLGVEGVSDIGMPSNLWCVSRLVLSSCPWKWRRDEEGTRVLNEFSISSHRATVPYFYAPSGSTLLPAGSRAGGRVKKTRNVHISTSTVCIIHERSERPFLYKLNGIF